ncbi:molybdate-anion transporter-like isoform X2 [Dendronephthya gigantea]|uniref:molybdate-anion transporter-like isoform X2 n=1 Tax=Dendronephthya gigantea TaxID=151771 RepID=UPI00106A8ACC|nr:molybdate-anion transporter-like isoform X2 [Dendronephthya gigantea]
MTHQMAVFIGTLCALVLMCLGTHWKTRSSDDERSCEEFKRFQKIYITVYLLATAADWLQGPHVYVLYESYGLSSKEIGELFVGGFASSMIFGTFIGSLADKCGRKLNCLIYAVLYGAACVTKHFSNYNILMVGRILAGVATSILFSAFESWAICEHSKRQLARESMGTLFANAVLGNSIVAVIAGLVAEIAASKFGFVAPFDLSLCTLLIMAVVLMSTWSENYGDKTGNIALSFQEALRVLRNDRRVLCLGLIQSLFEGAMYTFVLQWTPALTSTNQIIPHGLIFSGFMVSVMIGSSLFKIFSRRSNAESFMRIVYIVATVALSAPIFIAKGDILIYFSFLVFECCVGIFWPAMATMRGKYVPEETRATIMNIFRIPLNLIVILVLLQIDKDNDTNYTTDFRLPTLRKTFRCSHIAICVLMR